MGKKIKTLTRILIATTMSLSVTASVSPAWGDTIFVANQVGTVGDYTTSGTVLNASLITGLIDPTGLVVSGSDLFVANQGNGTIGEYTTTGTAVTTTFATGLSNVYSLAISGSDLFAESGAGGGSVAEYTTSGALVNASILSGIGALDPIAVSGSDLFVTNQPNGFGQFAIEEYTTAGTLVNGSVVTYGTGNPVSAIVVSGSDLFVTFAQGGGWEYTTAGAVVGLIPAAASSDFLAVSDGDLFESNVRTGTISEYTTSGQTVDDPLITGLLGPEGLAVEPTSTPEPAAFGLCAAGLLALYYFARLPRSVANSPWSLAVRNTVRGAPPVFLNRVPPSTDHLR